MQLATAMQESELRFSEPVRLLLDKKGQAVWSITPEETVYRAVQMMSERKVGALIVLSEGRLAGIVSERDYARKVILKGRNSQFTTVSEIMTTDVVTVTSAQSLEECMRLMTTRRIRHLPVVDREAVVGVLSIGDVVNWIVSSQQHTIKQLNNYINGAYPG